MIQYILTQQFLRFLVVGGIAALLHWLARFLLRCLLPFSLAVAIAYGVGMTIAFVLNSIFVFPQSEKPRMTQARDFIFVNFAFFPVVWLGSLQINSWLARWGMQRYTEELAHAVAIPLPMVATFLIYKFFTFKEKSQNKRRTQ